MKRFKKTKKDLKKHEDKDLLEKIKDFMDIDDSKKDYTSTTVNIFKDDESKRVFIGACLLILIILIIGSVAYYFIIYEPAAKQLEDEKNVKINEVNDIFKGSLSDDPNKQAILAKISAANSIEELNTINVADLSNPVLKSYLTGQVNLQKDKYDRITLVDSNNTTNIMNILDAKSLISSSSTDELRGMTVKKVDTVVIPLSITRRQAASGLLKEKDMVDIYKTTTNEESDTNYDLSNGTNDTLTNDNSTGTTYDSNNTSDRLVGGAKIISILRSKDSGVVESNINHNQSTGNRSYSQSTSLDVQQILAARSADSWDDNKLNMTLAHYGWQLSDYERIANVGDLDVNYIVMVEVPRDSVTNLLNNMDSLVLTIPTSTGPSWMDSEISG